jgi:MFS superfamily sulfate permease-like transporter
MQTIASKTGQQIDGNQEFIGQGLSNIIGGFFPVMFRPVRLIEVP